MNILFLNKFNDYWKDKYLKLKAEFPHVDFSAVLDADKRQDALKTADAIVTGRISEDEVIQAVNLKVIFVPFTGLNSFPLDAVKNKGIIISNTHANARFVAERAVTLALSLLGRVTEFHNDLKIGIWHRSHEDSDLWNTIQYKSVGIVGLGSIGLNIAKFVKVFGCSVTGLKKHPVNHKIDNVDEISMDLNYVMEKSDIVFVALPSTNETKGLINSNLLMKMNGKYLINVGRGVTVDEEGLYTSLKSGVLRGAALDVWYNYPGKSDEPVLPANKPFWEMPNVILSPHKASHTIEAVNAMIGDTVENIRSYIITGTPKNIAKL